MTNTGAVIGGSQPFQVGLPQDNPADDKHICHDAIVATSNSLAAGIHACRCERTWKGLAPSQVATVETPAFRPGFQPSRRPEGRGFKPEPVL
jgi:hypothetical protein